MLFKKKKMGTKTFDRDSLYPVIHKSICTGEKVAGFTNKHTRKFTDVMLIRNDEDLKIFLKTYDISKDEIRTEY